MDKIYLVTTLRIVHPGKWLGLKLSDYIVRSRIVGWFPSLEDAVWLIVRNEGDIYEAGHYNYCVIEETYSGLYPGINNGKDKERWFRWTKDKGGYLPIDKPKELEYNSCIG